ncbi:amino acid--tRNA ligase-related protein [Streptomyces sp. NPDC050732]|uniref:amino acid--tRNA ligase-related protein n=1 Tax=Streptomyces sp. NPDC050732 TaxID=3154632 RepID=UPI00341ABB91
MPRPDASARPAAFGRYIAEAQADGVLVVQPRMGFADPAAMRAGLLAVRDVPTRSVGTITVDSYTRVGDEAAVLGALRSGVPLNGYPITSYSSLTTQEMLAAVRDPGFPVQVRHGSARPQRIFAALALAGIDSTEGGPVSYCLPYGRTPLADSVRSWRESCEFFARRRGPELEPHLETFGGCVLGQLCPPGLLVALSVLEALFFRQHGIRSISLSYAQQTHAGQDEQAVRALRKLASELLDGCEWHVVLYTYMGLFPQTRHGATRLLRGSAELAVRSGAARLVVKTEAEAHRLPTVAENVRALLTAADAARTACAPRPEPVHDDTDSPVYQEARMLVTTVLGLADDIGEALLKAFAKGLLDFPFCLHADNAGRSRSYIDPQGRLMWSEVGAMPIAPAHAGPAPRLTATGLYDALAHVQRRYDHEPSVRTPAPSPAERYPNDTQEKKMTVVQPARPGPRPEDADAVRLDRHLTSPVTQAVLRVQNRMLSAARAFLSQHGFIELLPPLIGPVTDPGIRGSKQVDVDFYGHKYKLMTSAILYKQASLLAFDRVFYIAPNVRLEPLETTVTHRHLAEFHQIDVEIRDAGRDDAMRVAQQLVAYVVGEVVRDMPADLAALGRDPDRFQKVIEGRFGRITHREATDELIALGHSQDPAAEIDWRGEEILSARADSACFIVDYPKGSRGFYDREHPDRPGLLDNFDLIAPEGFGELASGGRRESDYATLITRMRETGENPSKYGWYLDIARAGLPPSAGFGIGLERFTRYVTGVDAVWQAAAYPRLPGVVSA